MGHLVDDKAGHILVVISTPYRVQEDRELGFRRVLRSEFSHLEVDDRVNSTMKANIFIAMCPSTLTSMAHQPASIIPQPAILVLARALQETGLGGIVKFVGHELNANSRMLLESGLMHFAIGHDIDREVAKASNMYWQSSPNCRRPSYRRRGCASIPNTAAIK